MGGRSRTRPKKDSFAFVSELSDSRLAAYGDYTSIAYQNFDNPSITRTGTPVNLEGFNDAISKEYEKRHGVKPSWSISDNPDLIRNHRKKQGFNDE